MDLGFWPAGWVFGFGFLGFGFGFWPAGWVFGLGFFGFWDLGFFVFGFGFFAVLVLGLPRKL